VIWRLGAIAVAALVALPMLGVAASLLDWRGEMWRHLAETQLGEIVGQHGAAAARRRLGTTAIGTGTAWLVTMHRFPLSRLLEWACCCRWCCRPTSSATPMPTCWPSPGHCKAACAPSPAGSAATTGSPTRLGSGVAVLFTLVLYPYVYLARGPRSSPVPAAARSAAASWATALAHLLRVGLPLARPAIAAGSVLALLEALADFGTVQYYGVPDLHDGDLPHLVRHGRSRRAPARSRWSCSRSPRCSSARAPFARPRPLSMSRSNLRENAGRATSRLARRAAGVPVRCRCCWASRADDHLCAARRPSGMPLRAGLPARGAHSLMLAAIAAAVIAGSACSSPMPAR
jgi:hypothetical protein